LIGEEMKGDQASPIDDAKELETGMLVGMEWRVRERERGKLPPRKQRWGTRRFSRLIGRRKGAGGHLSGKLEFSTLSGSSLALTCQDRVGGRQNVSERSSKGCTSLGSILLYGEDGEILDLS
jgi:hypothetical protein